MKTPFVVWICLFNFSLALSGCGSSPKTPLKRETESGDRYRSVVGLKGMVVSDDREASAWGVEILKKGGNAVDAAVATAFALAVTRPHFASLGGGGFLVYCPPAREKKKCTTFDYREKAPLGVTAETFKRKGQVNRQLSQVGALASGVPGVVDGLLSALEKYGKFPRAKILSRPIEIAERGIWMTPLMEQELTSRWSELSGETHEVFGDSDGTAPLKPGALISQKNIARVLSEIRKNGKKGFYEGWVAQNLIRELQIAGGIMTIEDLRKYSSTEKEPLQFNWKGYEFNTMGSPSGGGLILNQLSHFSDLAEKDGEFKEGPMSEKSILAISKAMNLAFKDRATYLGDSDFAPVPLRSLRSSRHLDAAWYGTGGENEGLNTTHLSVVDSEGGSVALTTTVNDYFGSGYTVPGLGIVMNDEMDDFNLEAQPNHPNTVAPGKKPLSSMSPLIVRDSSGEARWVIGAQGGTRIPTTVFLTLFYRLVGGYSMADAVFAPRFHTQWPPTVFKMEPNGFSEEIKSALEKKGYTLEFKTATGREQVIERRDGRVYGVSDPRTEGAAVFE